MKGPLEGDLGRTVKIFVAIAGAWATLGYIAVLVAEYQDQNWWAFGYRLAGGVAGALLFGYFGRRLKRAYDAEMASAKAPQVILGDGSVDGSVDPDARIEVPETCPVHDLWLHPGMGTCVLCWRAKVEERLDALEGDA